MSASGAVLAAGAALASGYLCLLAPGRAWLRGARSEPGIAPFEIALSVVFTTAIGLGLAACGLYSLPRLLALLVVLSIAGRAVTGPRGSTAVSAGRRRLSLSASALTGPCLLVAALAVYWPPYETHVAGTDSTAYLSLGAYLAREGGLSPADPLLARIGPDLRRELFRPALDGPAKPPYVRTPGGLSLASIDAESAQPNFFPAPMLWAAVCTSVAGVRYAGAYAGLFAGLSLWAAWAFARRRLPAPAALAVAVLAGLNVAGYWAGRFALSEPLTCFLLWTGLAALDAWATRERDDAAALAGVLLGAAGLVRIDYLLFVLVGLALRRLLARRCGWRPLPALFYACFASMAALTLLELASIEGGYALPIIDAWERLVLRATGLWADEPRLVAFGGGALLVSAAATMYRFGAAPVLAAVFPAAFVVVYTVFASQQRLVRSLGWLVDCLGVPALVLAALGLVVFWRERRVADNDGFFVVIVVPVGFLLLYDPHVQPFLLWALRRFVPLLIPATLFAAAVAAQAIVRRSTVLGVAVWGLLLATVLWPARSLWGQPLYRGAHEQLEELASVIPRDAIVLVDNRLGSYMLDTPLWLIHARQCLPVDLASAAGRKAVAELAATFADRAPLYLVTSGRQTLGHLPGIATDSTSRPAGGRRFTLLFPDQPGAASHVTTRMHAMPVAVFALIPETLVR